LNKKTQIYNTTELSHVEKTILGMSSYDLAKCRKEILKNSSTIKTKYIDIIIIKYDIFTR
jgi:hypothetical protein